MFSFLLPKKRDDRGGKQRGRESKAEERQDKADDAPEKRVSALLLSSVHRKQRQERKIARVKGKKEER